MLDYKGLFLYFHNRNYNPTSGRFLSEDPIGFAGGDANLYRYVENNPILFNDPVGLAKFCKRPVEGGGAGVGGSVGDFLNIENVHEYIQYEDEQGGTTGFFPTGDGLFGVDGTWLPESSNNNGATCSSKSYDDATLRKSVEDVKNQNNSYHLIPVFGNNCQSIMDRVRDRYRYNKHRSGK